MTRAIVDQEICIGCGMCEQTAPEVFYMEGSTAHVTCDPVPPHLAAGAKNAMAECPVQAIGIDD